jgi:cytoskeletal protein CcmA (bactofilin family)
MSETMQTVRRTASQSMLKALGAGKAALTTESADASAPAPEAKRAEPTVISANAEFKGAITAGDSVDIRGRVEGDVRAASITVYAGARIKGDLTADVILVQGEVEGRIQAQDVRLQGGANVIGEIAHGSLGIDTTAIFEGTIKRIASATAATP